jgi:hypothetical protein
MIDLRSCGIVLACGVCLTATADEPPSAPASTPYKVVDGRVDDATYRGWRAYHSACHTCHGVDAVGTNIAPNLLERIKSLSPHDFTIKVLTSYRIVLGSGDIRGDDPTAVREAMAEEILRRERGELIMPAWERDENVSPHVLDLYAYLKARSGGALGPGEPKRIEK